MTSKFHKIITSVLILHITTIHRSGFLPAPIRMTLNDLECPIQLEVRFTDGMLDVVCCGFRSWPCV